MGSQANPYAAYGGSVAQPPATGDPYAAYGGSASQSPTTAPAAQPQAQETRSASPSLPAPVQAVAEAVKDYGTGFMNEGKRTLGGILNILGNVMSDDPNAHYATPTVPVIGDISEAVAGHLKRGADWLNSNTENHGFFQHAGGFAENIAELMSPEALSALAKPARAAEAVEGMKALGAGGSEAKALPGGVDTAAKLADAGKIAKILQQYPRLASLVGMGMSAAARGATETGVQTFAKTGGDSEAAIDAAKTGATVGGILAPAGELLSQGVSKILPKMHEIEGVSVPAVEAPKPSASQQAGAEAFSKTARATAVPHMAGIGMTADQISQSLNRVHDFTGVADQLTQANAKVYDTLDNLTGGKFRQLNEQIKSASKAAFDGGKEAETHLQELHGKMEDLLSTAGRGQLSPEWMQRVKDSWRQSYILQDAGRLLDRSLDGLPGRTNVSQEQRGINGKELESGLHRMVERYGYETVTKALGPARVKNLEAIADATKTNSGRALLNQAVHSIAGFTGIMAGGTIGSAATGGSEVGREIGAALGYGAGHATKEAVGRVVDAIRANPRVGNAVLYMLKKGTSPDVYGPLIGSMITQSHEDGNK